MGRRLCTEAKPPPSLTPPTAATLTSPPTAATLTAPPTAAAATQAKKVQDDFDDDFDEFAETPIPEGPPPQLGVLGAVCAGVLGVCGFSVYRGYEARSWPMVQGKVLGWQVEGNLYSPVAKMTYKYEADGAEYVAEEKFGIVQFGPTQIMTNTVVYDLNGSVDVNVCPSDPAIHAMEPGWIGPLNSRVPANKLSEQSLKNIPAPQLPK